MMERIIVVLFDRAGEWRSAEVEPPTAHAAGVIAAELAASYPDKGVHVCGFGDEIVDDEVRDEVDTGAMRGHTLAHLPADRRASQASAWAQLDLHSARACILEAHAVHSSDPTALPSWWRDAARNDLLRALYWRDRANALARRSAVPA